MKQILSFCCACVLLLFSGGTFAAKTYSVNVQGLFDGPAKPSCSSITQPLTANPDRYADITCLGFEEAFAALPAGGVSFTVKVAKGERAGNYNSSIRYLGGSCKAGEPAGDAEVPMYYSNSQTGQILQTIRTVSQIVGTKDGCKIRAVGSDGTGICVGFPRNGVTLMSCGFEMQETGEDGGPDAPVDDSAPEYNGGGSGGTSPGGGGDGTGGDGGTGGGGTGGGGTGGGTGGDGGTGGGDGGTGDGGGTGGGGNGGDGSGDSGGGSCGGTGQPPCKIDETGTPEGKGLFAQLLSVLEFGDSERKHGIEDAISDAGKDTSVWPSFRLPSVPSTCTDPSITIDAINRTFQVPICQYISLIGAGFEAFWFVAFVFAIMSMVSRAMVKPVT